MLPLSLHINNFFSHKESYIDFTQFDSALLIGNTEGDYSISNGSGKSSILDSILWVLFNKARVAAMDDIILWNEKECIVMFEFKKSDVIYKIKRTRNRISSTSSVEFSYLSSDGDWIDISGSTAGLTNDKIIDIIKFDYNTFINSGYFRQNDISEFAETDPARKKEILKSIIDLSKWDEYEKACKIKLKNIKSEASILEAKIQDLDIKELDLAKSNSELHEHQRQLDIISENKVKLSEQIEQLQQKYQQIKNNLDTDQWDKIVSENNEANKALDRLNTALKVTEQELLSKRKTSEQLLNSINESKQKLSEISIDQDIDEKYKQVSDQLISFKSKASTSKALVEKLSKKQFIKGECNTCGQEVTDELHQKLLHSHEAEKELLEKEYIYCNNKINELNSALEKIEKIRKDNKKAEIYKTNIKTSQHEYDLSASFIQQKESEKQQISSDILEYTNKIKANMSILNSLKNDDFQLIHKQIYDLKSSLKNIDNDIAYKNQQVGILKQKAKMLSEIISSMLVEKEKLMDINKKVATYEKMNKLLGKNGVQTILLNALIEDLEKTSNIILQSICNEPMSIILETQRIGSDGISIVDTLDLKVRKDGFVQNFKSLSGGEQFRISLSLRLAMSEISSRHGGSSLEFLLLDEINSPLDRHGTENLFVNVIKALEKKYKILVITHNDSLKEKFVNVIEVTKVNGESSVSFFQK